MTRSGRWDAQPQRAVVIHVAEAKVTPSAVWWAAVVVRRASRAAARPSSSRPSSIQPMRPAMNWSASAASAPYQTGASLPVTLTSTKPASPRSALMRSGSDSAKGPAPGAGTCGGRPAGGGGAGRVPGVLAGAAAHIQHPVGRLYGRRGLERSVVAGDDPVELVGVLGPVGAFAPVPCGRLLGVGRVDRHGVGAHSSSRS